MYYQIFIVIFGSRTSLWPLMSVCRLVGRSVIISSITSNAITMVCKAGEKNGCPTSFVLVLFVSFFFLEKFTRSDEVTLYRFYFFIHIRPLWQSAVRWAAASAALLGALVVSPFTSSFVSKGPFDQPGLQVLFFWERFYAFKAFFALFYWLAISLELGIERI